MTKTGTYTALTMLVLCLLLHISCKRERPVCFEPVTATMKVGAYQAIETDTGFVIADSSLPNAVIFSLDTPKVQLNAAAALKKFQLLLSPHKDSTQFIILADSIQITTPALYDTLTLYYSRKLTFLSVACGYTYFFSLKGQKTTNNYIDSVTITDTEVTNAANTEHIKIYF